MKVNLNYLMGPDWKPYEDEPVKQVPKRSFHGHLTIKKMASIMGCMAFVGMCMLYQSVSNKEAVSADELYNESAANPSFTVQHVGNVMTPDIGSGDGTVKVLKTDSGGYHAALDEDGSIKQTESLGTLYEEYKTDWFKTSSIAEASFLNGEDGSQTEGYILKEIWFGKNKESENQSDFLVLSVPDKNGKADLSKVKLTNNPEHPDLSEAAGGYYGVNGSGNYEICVEDGDVIRLVFESVEGWEYGSADVFDYDVSDGGYYLEDDYYHRKDKRATSTQKDAGVLYVDAMESGIHLPENYLGSGAKLAFGGADIGTELADESLTDGLDTINVRNYGKQDETSGTGVTKGLVTGIEGDGSLSWKPGISVPDLFGTSETVGKTDYRNGKYSFTFRQNGFSKTLSSVESEYGTAAEGLESLKDVGGSLTNSFWIADNAPSYGADEHDPVWGSGSEKILYYKSNDRAPEVFKASDDKLNHNSFFGFSHTEDFTLSPGYAGPLSFFSYSDDDMWVFAAQVDKYGQVIGDTAVQVADLGGVHDGAGYYCDLWDSIDKVPYGEDEQNWRLFVYWLERDGKSASCYVNYTLPDKAIVDSHETAALTIEAKQTGSDGHDRMFVIEDSFCNRYEGIYNNEEKIMITGGEEFVIADGSYVTVSGLFAGSEITVSETGAKTVWSSTGEGYEEKNLVTGTAGTDGWMAFLSAANAGTLSISADGAGMPADGYRLKLSLKDAGVLEALTMDRFNNPTGIKETDENGEMNILLATGETIVLCNLPEDIKFSLVPVSSPGWHVAEILLSGAEASGSEVSGGLPARVIYRYAENDRKSVQLSMKQSVGNDWNDSDLVIGRGTLISYKITVMNPNDVPVSAVVSDKLPDGFTLMESSLSDGGVVTGQTINWDLTLDAGSVKELSFTCQVDVETCGNYINNAAVTIDGEDVGNYSITSVIP